MTRNKKFFGLMIITVISLAAVGCSDDSNPVSAPPAIDTAPPAVPTGVSVENIDGMAVISWDRNTTDSDLAGFVLTRESDEGSVELVASPSLIQSYQDSTVPTGTSTYYVYSVDEVGNQSAGAGADLVNAGSHTREIHLD